VPKSDKDRTLDKSTPGNTTTSSTPDNDIEITQINEKVTFPYEHRVFVCLGKLKYSRDPYVWVMSISDDYRDVTMWDPKLFKKYQLPNRVDDDVRLKNFLLGKYYDYGSVSRGQTIVEEEQEESFEEEEPEKDLYKKKNIEQINLRGVGEDSMIQYDEEQDKSYRDDIMKENDHLLHEYDVVGKDEDDNAFSKFKCINKTEFKNIIFMFEINVIF
jgi:hypothetical protein